MENPPHQPHEPHHQDGADSSQNRTHLFQRLDWNYWANSAYAILGLLLATFCATPMFDFFNCTAKVIFIAVGFVIGISVVAVFVGQSVSLHRKGQTTAQLEAQAEERQRKLREKIDHLESELNLARQQLKEYAERELTEEQETEIINCCSAFAGQKFSIQCVRYDSDGIRYGQQISHALLESGWIFEGLFESPNFGKELAA